MLQIMRRVLAVAFTATAVGLLTSATCAAPRVQPELINRPPNPFACRTDEGYERWTACDMESGGN
jgi:hypothetical protein